MTINPTAGLKTPLHNKDWRTERFKYLYQKIDRSVLEDDEVITAFRDGMVTLRSNRREDGFTFADKEIGYQGVMPGDLVIHAMDSFAGAIGVSDSRGKCSPVYSIVIPRDEHRVYTSYWGYYLRSLAIAGFIESLAKGIRERSTDFRWKDISNLLVNFPFYETQKEIADFLDQETTRIDELIEKKEAIIQTWPLKAEALIDSVLFSSSTTWIRFGYAAKMICRPVNKNDSELYVPLGLYNRGRGIFHKEEICGQDLGDSTFNWIKPNDLIFSGQFAWEGAVALAGEREDQKIASHRYPIYNAKNGIENGYLFSYFRTHRGKFLMNDCSRGAAGRNRPLNTNRLEKELIPILSEQLQKQVAEFVQKEVVLKSKITASIQSLNAFKDSIITEAVTGQLDIQQWLKRGITDRRLDKIEKGLKQGKKAYA